MRLAASAAFLAGLFATTSAYALDYEAFSFVSAELYSRGDDPGGHGAILLGGRLDGLPRDARLELEFNTDTLSVGVENFRLNDDWWAGARLSGEYLFAGLLTDYHQRGEFIEGRGISASYFGGTAHVTTRREDHLFVRFEWTARRHFFDELETTGANVVLPPTTTIHSPRMRLTWWDFDYDPSHDEWHRPLRRYSGVGFGLAFGVDHRDVARRWGDLRNGRNTPSRNSGVAEQWFRIGVPFARHWRFEFVQESGIHTSPDDITRRRIGGMNPYVLPVAGAPWASHLADQWVGASAKQRVAVHRTVELGVRADAAWLNDRDRTGESAFGGLYGVAAEIDWRPQDVWQVDGRLGWSLPTDAWASEPHLGVYLGVGRSF